MSVTSLHVNYQDFGGDSNLPHTVFVTKVLKISDYCPLAGFLYISGSPSPVTKKDAQT